MADADGDRDASPLLKPNLLVSIYIHTVLKKTCYET